MLQSIGKRISSSIYKSFHSVDIDTLISENKNLIDEKHEMQKQLNECRRKLNNVEISRNVLSKRLDIAEDNLADKINELNDLEPILENIAKCDIYIKKLDRKALTDLFAARIAGLHNNARRTKDETKRQENLDKVERTKELRAQLNLILDTLDQ